MRDHCIIKVDQKWYCVGTSEPVWTSPNSGVHLLVSEDLIHWKQHSFFPQLGYEPVYYKDGRFYIQGPTGTEQIIEY